MDDLAGLDWTGSSGVEKRPQITSNSYLLNARSTPPISGRSTPLSTSAMRSASPSKPSTTGNDIFANLVSFGTGSSGKNLSLAERQRQLAEKKALEEKQRRAQLDAQFGGNNDQFWNNLEKSGGQRNTSTGPTPGGSAQLSSPGFASHIHSGNGSINQGPGADDDENDLLAAFNASAPVDKSTNFPIPHSTASPVQNAGLQSSASNNLVLEDDDPFGLGEMSQKATQPNKSMQQPEEDDDILGLLAKPVSEFAKPIPDVSHKEPQDTVGSVENTTTLADHTSPVDRAVAELVDMGFPAEKASQALATTGSGTDVQSAVGWLLNQAHAESRDKARGRSQNSQVQPRSERLPDESHGNFSREGRDSGLPIRARGQDRFDERSQSRRRAEKDAAQLATEFGNTLFKSANSLWKTGTKKVQQAVLEFNTTPDSSQPRWMRETPPERTDYRNETVEVRPRPQQGNRASRTTPKVTDEAMMLEMERAPPSKPPRPSRNQQPSPQHTIPQGQPRDFSPSQHLPSRPRHVQEGMRSTSASDRSRLSRLAADDQASQAYVSPARRRKQLPTQAPPEAEFDLLEGSTRSSPALRTASRSPSGQPQPPSRPATSPPVALRPKAPPRRIPPVSSSTLLSSHKYRQEGSAAYKRGDYAAAHTSYSSALSLLPGDHPVTIILLTNHALTALKVGEPKLAISDADRALTIIGPSKGESEKIDLGNGEPNKEMREFFGKAMMRKAEALEQLERWADAAKIWRETVEAGHGGSASIQGRTRCEKAAGIRAPSAAQPQPNSSARPVPRSKPTPSTRPPVRPRTTAPVQSAEAVNRLRAANEAADRVDNEKFALADTVEARLTAWKGGKQDNLRALLASLDTVLWPEAGWKKISMAELVLPNKVKIHYMKGIAKVHPDKIPVTATTEQRMIAGAVFSTLNEAWDKFKQENGL